MGADGFDWDLPTAQWGPEQAIARMRQEPSVFDLTAGQNLWWCPGVGGYVKGYPDGRMSCGHRTANHGGYGCAGGTP